MGDAIAQQRIGEQTHAIQFDQDRCVAEEHDTVCGLVSTTGSDRTIDHDETVATRFIRRSMRAPTRERPSSWRRLLGFGIRTLIMLGIQALVLVVLTALLPGHDSLSLDARRPGCRRD